MSRGWTAHFFFLSTKYSTIVKATETALNIAPITVQKSINEKAICIASSQGIFLRALYIDPPIRANAGIEQGHRLYRQPAAISGRRGCMRYTDFRTPNCIGWFPRIIL